MGNRGLLHSDISLSRSGPTWQLQFIIASEQNWHHQARPCPIPGRARRNRRGAEIPPNRCVKVSTRAQNKPACSTCPRFRAPWRSKKVAKFRAGRRRDELQRAALFGRVWRSERWSCYSGIWTLFSWGPRFVPLSRMGISPDIPLDIPCWQITVSRSCLSSTTVR